MRSPIQAIEAGQSPVARTNMLQLKSTSHEALLAKLLQPVPGSNLHINCGVFQLQRNKNESSTAYFTRVDARIREIVGKDVGAKSTAGIHYNRLQADKGTTVFAFLGTKPQSFEQIISQLQVGKVSLTRVISVMINLRLKMDFLLDASRQYEIQPVEYNADLYIGVMPISRSISTPLVDALAVQIYLSEQQELALTLERKVFSCSAEVSTTSVENGTTFMFFYGGKRYEAKHRQDARKYKGRKYMLFSNQDSTKAGRNDYRYCTNFHLNDCLNRLEKILGNTGAEFEPIRFSATHKVRDFLSPATACQRPLVVIDDYQAYANPQEQMALHAAITEKLKPQQILLGKDVSDPAQLPADGRIYLVINQKNSDGSSIINRATEETYSTFWSAIQAIDSKNGPALKDFDLYTRIKYERFHGQKPFVCQGYDLAREESEHPDQLGALQLDNIRLEKIAYELWIKESVFDRRQVIVPNANYAPRQVELLSCRRGSDNRRWVAIADVKLDGNAIQLDKVTRYDNSSSGEFDRRYPLLAKALSKRTFSSFEALFNDSFMMRDVETGCWLNVYESIRIPQIIGNAAFDNVQADFESKSVRRFTKPDKTPLPYYLTPTKNKQYHFVFLQCAGKDGIRFFVSNASAAKQALEKQSLVYNVLVYGPNGEQQKAFGHPLVEAFFSSFTYDLLRLRQSAKTSILEKVITLHLEN